MIFSSSINAQDEPYSFTFAPDLWYNDVDGIRTGIRVFGEVEGSFKDGPHRLDAGLWLGTWFPDNPVSYYLSFTEPIEAISDFGNEGNIQILSSIRTGYSQHKIQLNKRWQSGFDEYDYLEFNTSISSEKLIDDEYRPFPSVWQDEAKTLVGTQFLLSRKLHSGQFIAFLDFKTNLNKESGRFSVGTLEITHRFDLSERFKFRIRGFAGLATDNVAPEHRFLTSMASPQNWLSKGVSRAKGTIAQPWLEAGSFHVGGGANLRGYLNRDINSLNTANQDGAQYFFPIYKSIFAFNTEIEFPNPLNNSIKTIAVIEDLTELRTYLFADFGKGSDYTLIEDPDAVVLPQIVPPFIGGASDNPNLIADAGIGLQLSINIPDYLGKDRGFFIRYDIPFWLSDPEAGESNFSFRQLVGLGAIISF
ncbi:MAG: hypothetical protein BalsKO_12580 [Balneolaceae bacterium]